MPTAMLCSVLQHAVVYTGPYMMGQTPKYKVPKREGSGLSSIATSGMQPAIISWTQGLILFSLTLRSYWYYPLPSGDYSRFTSVCKENWSHNYLWVTTAPHSVAWAF